MPQFYWFTFIGSLAMGWLLREYFINYDNSLLMWMAVLFILIFINEKTGIGEDVVDLIEK